MIELRGVSKQFDRQGRVTALDRVDLGIQAGELVAIIGPSGSGAGTDRDVLSYAPDRGLARSLVGRASYTIGPTRSLAIESVANWRGDGVYAKADYAHLIGEHWRMTLRLIVIRGEPQHYIGQYRLNSFAGAVARFSY
jgi:predicted ABC-type transport system involved in lysophospholipase L1 biosynthesis ATPase subunit